jgi:hypothetical protein
VQGCGGSQPACDNSSAPAVREPDTASEGRAEPVGSRTVPTSSSAAVPAQVQGESSEGHVPQPRLNLPQEPSSSSSSSAANDEEGEGAPDPRSRPRKRNRDEAGLAEGQEGPKNGRHHVSPNDQPPEGMPSTLDTGELYISFTCPYLEGIKGLFKIKKGTKRAPKGGDPDHTWADRLKLAWFAHRAACNCMLKGHEQRREALGSDAKLEQIHEAEHTEAKRIWVESIEPGKYDMVPREDGEGEVGMTANDNENGGGGGFVLNRGDCMGSAAEQAD